MPRVCTSSLQGGLAQHSPEEDSALLLKEDCNAAIWPWLAAGERGPVHNPRPPPPPPLAAAAKSVLGPICPVPGRGSGNGGDDDDAFTLGASDPVGEAVGRRFPPRGLDCGWDGHPIWAVCVGRLGVSSLEALIGCLVSVRSRGGTFVQRRISEDCGQALLLQLASG